jgi:hypothetical protein
MLSSGKSRTSLSLKKKTAFTRITTTLLTVSVQNAYSPVYKYQKLLKPTFLSNRSKGLKFSTMPQIWIRDDSKIYSQHCSYRRRNPSNSSSWMLRRDRFTQWSSDSRTWTKSTRKTRLRSGQRILKNGGSATKKFRRRETQGKKNLRKSSTKRNNGSSASLASTTEHLINYEFYS